MVEEFNTLRILKSSIGIEKQKGGQSQLKVRMPFCCLLLIHLSKKSREKTSSTTRNLQQLWIKAHYSSLEVQLLGSITGLPIYYRMLLEYHEQESCETLWVRNRQKQLSTAGNQDYYNQNNPFGLQMAHAAQWTRPGSQQELSHQSCSSPWADSGVHDWSLRFDCF